MSPNARRGAHWSRLREDKMMWLALLVAARGRHDARDDWHTPYAARVTIREWGIPARDLDNAIAANKWLIDALVTANWLVDDNPRHLVGLSIEQPDRRPDWIKGGVRTHAVEIVVEAVQAEVPA